MDGKDTLEIPQSRCISWARNFGKDCTTHQQITGSAISKFSSLDSAGIFHIDGRIPIILLNRVDCDQKALFERRESLKDKQENDRKEHSTMALVETELTGSKSNSMKHEKTEFSNETIIYTEKDNASYSSMPPESTVSSPNNHEIEMIVVKQEFEESNQGSDDNYLSESSDLEGQVKNEDCGEDVDSHLSAVGTHMANKCSKTTSAKLFRCSMCGYRCSQSALKIHMRIHTGEKPFECSLCDYKSGDSGNFKRHLRIHTGEKPFPCSICSYSGSNSGRLTEHMRTHTGVKPFKCTVCDYKSAQSTALKRHMRTHNVEKQYKCLVCDYESTVYLDVRRHMRTHTDETPFE